MCGSPAIGFNILKYNAGTTDFCYTIINIQKIRLRQCGLKGIMEGSDGA
ncbi:hypothetical protein SAMN02745945_02895 [Peptoclostridium litorale DSM 5388]|uniref:Uncharacterized protein n=1 Tax=Peptoclostridium litorale DSM 5388 TaxID=1121324 RepID=A0A069RBR4_PEPLI|nr:hypothetical protein CLIT_16c00120 [Peptoclostridium litorale DSM 5388]SIO35307.1 hypothetical protein SAMN02745945_02895 [Peptoclostridium litorale DSM 5388]